jgi:DNA (cytosine-5)-methyltransferase 1
LPTNTSREQESNNVNGGHKNYGDITKINADELPDFDCLVGGFPCQAFSIAGKRKGFDDTRGTLFFDLARILRAKRPRLFVFENVKGLLSHDNGQTFSTIISTLTELGYDVQWQVLNSKNHGVPQNRERVIIVGHLRGTPRPKVFPITEQDRTTLGQNHLAIAMHNTRKIATVTDTVNTLSSTFRGHPDGDGRPAIIINKKCQSKNKDYASTLTGGGHSGGNHSDMDLLVEDMKIRRLTPVECERLQGFPDDWTKYGIGNELISDTQRYKMCGNAVTTNVIQDVFERIFENEIN